MTRSRGVGPRRLRSPRAISAVFAAGRPIRRAHVHARARRRDDRDLARLTTIATKRVGNAVTRKRCQRRLRAAANHASWPAGHDVVLIATESTAIAAWDELQSQVHDVSKRITDLRATAPGAGAGAQR